MKKEADEINIDSFGSAGSALITYKDENGNNKKKL